jgi:tetratricopeptide (TPR) repeat protein
MSEHVPTSEPNGNGLPASPATPVTEYVAHLIAAIEAEDGKAVAEAVDNLAGIPGGTGGFVIRQTVLSAGLTDRMLDALKTYANSENSARAWAHLSIGATILGRQDVAVEAARTGLKIDPSDPNAALMVIINANERGDFAEALKVLNDIANRIPAAKNEPAFVLQLASAQLGSCQPQQALATLDAALANLTNNGFEFDGRFLRARALRGIPERLNEALSAWKAAVKAARVPDQVDRARDGLVEALMQLQKYDAALGELDVAIKDTTNESRRIAWVKLRASLLARNGDVAGALSIIEDLLKTATAPDDRVELHLYQARIAVFGKLWVEAGGYFDAALAGIPSTTGQTNDRADKIRIEKIQSIGGTQFDLVTADLDALDKSWTSRTWPVPIDLRIVAMLAAGKGSEALTWLDEKCTRTSALAKHPAAHQLRGEILIKLKGLDEALPEYASAATVAPEFRDDPRAWVAALMGAFIMQQWQLVADAFAQLGKAGPEYQDPTIRMFVAQAQLRRGDLEAALKLTDDDLQAVSPTAQAIRDSTRAEAQLRLGRLDEALATTDAALKRAKAGASADIPPEFLLSINLLRAQALNAKEKFSAAYDAATAAIDVPDQPGASLPGLTPFVRLAAFMQRSSASYRLGNLANAHSDVDKAITGYEQMRNSSIVRALKTAPEFQQFEFSLWFAKGAILDAEDRTEEALAAYERAERFEAKGNAATLGVGYALSGTGAFAQSLEVFDKALQRATSARERSEAFAGKGRSLVRLGRFEEGVAALQAALGERLVEPEKEPQVFELLGIAYDALKRNGAAKRAFRRAWDLTKPEKRSANLVRGITAAELRLNNPKGALKFLDDVCQEIDEWRRNNPGAADEPHCEVKEDSKLIFNRALALDGIGKRREAIRCLARASEAGLDQAKEVLNRFNEPDRLTRWTNDWFGVQAKLPRRILGLVLAIIAVTGFGAPLFQWWADGKIGWYLLLVPSLVALLLLALPNIKSIGYGDAKVEFSAEPLPATSREATAVAAPESFITPVLSATLLSKPLLDDRKDPTPALDHNFSLRSTN